MNQQQLLAHAETTAQRLLETIHDLQAGETSALERFKSHLSSLSAEHSRLETMMDAPVYLGG